MSDKYLDDHGVGTLWAAIKKRFVQQVSGKGLSTEDFTTAEKNKLAGIEAGANAYALPTASANVKGGIKVGSHLRMDADGVLSAETGGEQAVVIEAGVSRFKDGETVTLSPFDPAELEQAAETNKSVLLRLKRQITGETHILPLYRVVKNVVEPESQSPVDRYSFGAATDKTTIKLLIVINHQNETWGYAAEPLYLKTLSASELNALAVSEKGAANGVCPLNANGVIPGEYIPGGGDEDRYVVNVKVDVYGHLRTDIPAADADELMEIAQHEFPELRLVVSDVMFYKAFLAAKYPAHCVFTFLNGKKLLVYDVNTTNGTISITSEFTFITEEA